MEYDDEDPWAKQSPENEKEDALNAPRLSREQQAAGEDSDGDDDNNNHDSAAAFTSTGSIVHNTTKVDEDAWDAESDDGANNDESFVEATSRMSLSASFVAEEVSLDTSGGGFEDTLPSASTSSNAIAGPSSFPNAFEDNTASASRPPLDDFEDDNGDDDDDGFGEFGEPAQAGGKDDDNNDDDDDFGDFDEAGVAQDASFGFDDDQQPEAGPSTLPGSAAQPTEATPAGHGGGFFGPPVHIDWENIWQDEEKRTAAIMDYYKKVYPDINAGIDDSPERLQAWDRIDRTLDPEDIILSGYPEAKKILQELDDLTKYPIPIQPWDYKRSNIRLEAMRAKGIPVNLDDVSLLSHPDHQQANCELQP